MAEVTLRVEATPDRRDARGEYVVWIQAVTATALGTRPYEFVVVRGRHQLPWGGAGHPVSTLASVRISDPVRGGEDECRLDMTLRDAIGVRVGETVVLTPANRCIRPGLGLRIVAYKWLVCRVHMTFAGDMETGICRAGEAQIENLGLLTSGMVVMESVRGAVVRQLRPLRESHLAIIARMRERPAASLRTPSDLAPGVRLDALMSVPEDQELPGVFMDLDTRLALGVVVGDVVWVRRSAVAVSSRLFATYGTPLVLTVLGTALALGAPGAYLAAAAGLLLLAQAIWEARASV